MVIWIEKLKLGWRNEDILVPVANLYIMAIHYRAERSANILNSYKFLTIR